MNKKKKITVLLLCCAMMLPLLPNGMAEESDRAADEIATVFSQNEDAVPADVGETVTAPQEVSVEHTDSPAENADILPEIDENTVDPAEETGDPMTADENVAEENTDIPSDFEETTVNADGIPEIEEKTNENFDEDFPPKTKFWGETEASENGITLFSTTAEDFAWELSDDGTLTISGNGDMPNWEGSNVSDISTPWYSQRSSIKSVVIEDGITSIGNCAFAWCPNLTSVTLPDSITSLGHHAFVQCWKLTDITLPSGVTEIGHNAFAACFVLEKLTIPENVTKINHRAFYQCYKLESITIPEKVTDIDGEAFYECNKLKEITIPKNVVSMGDSVFYGCDALTSVTILGNVTNIGNYACCNCPSLTSVTIPESVTSIGSHAFFYCTGLTSVTIPASVTSIGYNAFYGCSSDLFMYVYPGSYAEEYAISNNINYAFVQGNNIKLTVYDGDNNAITSGYTVNWYEKGSDTATATGNTLYGADEEKEYEYEIILGEELKKDYYIPPKISASAATPEVTHTLEKIGSVKLTGIIIDADGKPICDAEAVIEQIYEDGYINTITAKSDETGKYTAEIKNLPTDIKYRKNGYYESDYTITENIADCTESDLGKTILIALPNSKIKFDLKMYAAVENGGESEMLSFNYDDNIKFELFDTTKSKSITEYTVQYPYIIIDEDTDDGDVIRITAQDTETGLKSTSAECAVNKGADGSVKLFFTENGKIKINNFVNSQSNRIMLFDADGKLVETHLCGGAFESGALAEGDYTVAVIEKNNILNNVSSLNMLDTLGVTDDDCFKANVSVKCGVVTTIESVEIPHFDEERFKYTEDAETRFSLNTKTTTTGSYVLFKATYRIKDEYDSENQTVIFELPENIDMINGSMSVDGKLSPYKTDGNKIIVQTSSKSASVRFYAVAKDEGDYNIRAYLSFKNGSSELSQVIGSEKLSAKLSEIRTAKLTSQKSISVSGTTMPESTIKIFDGSKEVLTTTSNKLGKWNAVYEFSDDTVYSYHKIHAEIKNPFVDGVVVTESKDVIYDENAVTVSKVTMINTAHGANSSAPLEYVCVFDFINLSGTVPSYWYWPTYPTFTFVVEFLGDPSNIVEAYVVTENSCGDETYVEVTYDSVTGNWIGKHNYATNDIPVSVNVAYKSKYDSMQPFEFYEKAKNAVSAFEAETSITDEGLQYDITDGEYKYSYIIIINKHNSPEDADKYFNEKYPGTILDGIYNSGNNLANDIICTEIIYDDEGTPYTIEIKNNTDEVRDPLNPEVVLTKTDTPSEDDTPSSGDAPSSGGSTPSGGTSSGGETSSGGGTGSDTPSHSSPKKHYNCDDSDCTCMEGITTNDAIEAFMQMYRKCYDNQSGLGTEVYYRAIEDHLRSRRIYANVSAILAAYNSITSINGVGRNLSNTIATEGLERVSNGVRTFMSLVDLHDSFDDHMSALQQYHDLFMTMNKYRQELNCGCSHGLGDDEPETPNEPQNVSHTLDPSGYVYEAVPSNRVEGVTAQAYVKQEITDDFGISTGEEETVVWDSEAYNQINPQLSDINGEYGWFVPDGSWLVKFSKDGYYDTDSTNDPAADENGYLPVPPPQTDVNVAMVSKSAPTVESVNVYNNEIQIIFSQYMDIESVNSENVKVSCDGKDVKGTISPANAEYNYEQTVQYASIFTFTPENELKDSASIEINKVKNYNSKEIETKFVQTKEVRVKPEKISVAESVDIAYNSGELVEISILPEKSGAGKELTVTSSSSTIVGVVNGKITADENGKATVMLSGKLPGESEITVTLDGTDISAVFKASVGDVATDSNVCQKVAASIASGTTVAKGTKVTLSTETEGAEIYYTLDGTNPLLAENKARIKYTEPIIINENTFIVAYAVKEGMGDSATSGFVYNIESEEKINVQVTAEEHGTATGGGEYLKNADVTITATPDSGYNFGGWYNGETLVSSDAAYTFKAEKDIALVAKFTKQSSSGGGGGGGGGSSSSGGSSGGGSFAPITNNTGKTNTASAFGDVKAEDWFFDNVNYVVENGLMNGVSATEFAPEDNLTRAMLVTILYRAEGKPAVNKSIPFADVTADSYYANAVIWAQQNGIVSGVSETEFAPDENITREQIAAIVYRYAKYKGYDTSASADLAAYADADEISEYAIEAMKYAVGSGLIKGKTATTLNPKDTATRAEIAAILQRFIEGNK